MSWNIKVFITCVVLLITFSETLPAQQTKNTGYFNNTDFSYLMGVGSVLSYTNYAIDNQESNWGLNTVNGIKLRNSVFGIGMGYEQWANSFTIPAFFRYQLFFKDIKPSLFEYFDVGYTFGSAKKSAPPYPEEKGRFLFSTGLGVNIRIDDGSFVSISAFYKLQKMMVESNKADYRTIYHFIGLKIGVAFY